MPLTLQAENVLLQRTNGQGPGRSSSIVAKVADFGLAQVLPLGQEALTQGIHGTVSDWGMGASPCILLRELPTLGIEPRHALRAWATGRLIMAIMAGTARL